MSNTTAEYGGYASLADWMKAVEKEAEKLCEMNKKLNEQAQKHLQHLDEYEKEEDEAFDRVQRKLSKLDEDLTKEEARYDDTERLVGAMMMTSAVVAVQASAAPGNQNKNRFAGSRRNHGRE